MLLKDDVKTKATFVAINMKYIETRRIKEMS